MTRQERKALQAISRANFTAAADPRTEVDLMAADLIYEVVAILQQEVPGEDVLWSLPGMSSADCASVIPYLREAAWLAREPWASCLAASRMHWTPVSRPDR